jgi:hypothetical protein
MNALNKKDFENFWFTSGTPTFLITILKKTYKTFDPINLTSSRDFLGTFDVNAIPAVPLMFQAGYLTITGYNSVTKMYTLDYPNDEVRVAFQKYLLEIFANLEANMAGEALLQFFDALNNKAIERAVELLHQLFAHVPYQLHKKQESYYHSLMIMVCVGAGIKMEAEMPTSHGRIDLVMHLPNFVYVTEIKFTSTLCELRSAGTTTPSGLRSAQTTTPSELQRTTDPAEAALEQIKRMKYYERYINKGKKIVLLGLSFKREPRSFDITYAMEELQ